MSVVVGRRRSSSEVNCFTTKDERKRKRERKREWESETGADRFSLKWLRPKILDKIFGNQTTTTTEKKLALIVILLRLGQHKEGYAAQQ